MDDISGPSGGDAEQNPQNPITDVLPVFGTHDTKYWVETRLRSVGKWEAFQEAHRRRQNITPFEMQFLINPQEVSMAVETHLTRLPRFIEMLRNWFILAPLLITWLSLATAGAAYQQSLAIDKNLATTPFLQLWEEGFPALKAVAIGPWHIALVDGHGYRGFTFSQVALFDAGLLGVLLAFTMIEQFLTFIASLRSQNFYKELSAEMLDIAKGSDMWAISSGQEHMTDWARDIHATMGHVNRVLNGLQNTIDEQKKAVRDLKDDNQNVHEAIKELERLYQWGKETYEQLKILAPRMADSAASMADNQSTTTERWGLMSERLAVAIHSIAQVADRLDGGQRQQRLNTLDQREQSLQPRGKGERKPHPVWQFWRRWF